MRLDKYLKLDKKIIQLSRQIKIINALEAENSQDEKKRFLSGVIKNPQFQYRKVSCSISKVRSEINNLKIKKDSISEIYEDIINRLRIKCEILESIGDEKRIRQLSKELYGKPSKALVQEACKLLINLDRKKESSKDKKNHTPEEAREIIKKYLKKIGINGWRVILRKQHAVSVASLSKVIKISKYQMYSINNIKLLIQHEVNGHVLRAMNGYRQPFKVFVIGLPNYLPTEEGVAIYLEEKSNLSTVKSKKRLALRVIAVDMVYKGADFRQVFDVINDHEKDQKKCWDIAYRVFRGGGFLKDHVYLKGYLKVKKYLEEGGELEDLYLGKYGIEQLDLIRRLHSDGILKGPRYLPEILR